MAPPSDEYTDPDIIALLGDALESLSEAERGDLRESHRGRRAHPRKLCIIPVEYSDSEGSSYRNYTLDISTGGVFIETCEAHTVGHELWLSLSFPRFAKPFRVAGRVAWRGPNGVGVKFEGLSEEQQGTLSSIIEEL
jgi:Tfp pilus assembly protein PilZ